MRILVIGDSITRGTQGVGYVPRLARGHPQWQLENAGVNGEPLQSIGRRLLQRLAAAPTAYDAVVCEAGYNDLLLPTFAERGFWFRQALGQMRRQGHEPLADAAAFEQAYAQLLTAARALSPVPVVLATLGCLGENLTGGLNAPRRAYNAAIRRVAARHGCLLADAEAAFDAALPAPPPAVEFQSSFVGLAFADKLLCALGRADALSRQRGLHLTIDGGHLNSRGAELFAQAVEAPLLTLAAQRQLA
ncbi:SGNH/GDSL hydrolase family protein [Hymenobacter sp. 15J16-1T3B]|uniref:SGNH/GDSL hydrolase family protein n=1 Tax=Hymenobacter sp. 15J16-1T3B TaxID=2886941 RepID=UPI001D11537D|nr:SGNH/GDSL hydrolase family protein [Hymenobacter sp. 15J16-1T3B]MCC3160665.1 SGNH/GDSL hydrolase family protein [Hymenobacter sp. 15J16-1T3B]